VASLWHNTHSPVSRCHIRMLQSFDAVAMSGGARGENAVGTKAQATVSKEWPTYCRTSEFILKSQSWKQYKHNNTRTLTSATPQPMNRYD
jgi:hypothetical protein